MEQNREGGCAYRKARDNGTAQGGLLAFPGKREENSAGGQKGALRCEKERIVAELPRPKRHGLVHRDREQTGDEGEKAAEEECVTQVTGRSRYRRWTRD